MLISVLIMLINIVILAGLYIDDARERKKEKQMTVIFYIKTTRKTIKTNEMRQLFIARPPALNDGANCDAN